MARSIELEGNWYAVPLEGHGYAAVLVARGNADGILVGYFFGPRRHEIPSLEDVASLAPSSADLVKRFGDVGIANGVWPLIGRADAWNPDDWPLPVFVRHDPLGHRWYKVVYQDNDPNSLPREAPVSADEAASLPDDGLGGHVLVQRVLDRRLD